MSSRSSSWYGRRAPGRSRAEPDFQYSKWIADTFRKVGLCPVIGGAGPRARVRACLR
ncbi:unnamed protein product (plasmid) [Mycetohabitans rhizoxinica HKI 454]|uniref:Uncharacterized protein n=1 Tax=Mycetohabitans rhizoxinica (strain DSM 19002 / CIP 109453 / HKI 454) TaxID=882378 RepID=E5AVR3_MYCRK|nr:unnamed protein product [Mycetohabitans rhizoxinica HKI 454]